METHSQFMNSHSQCKPKESHSQCKPMISHSQRKPMGIYSQCEPKETRLQCEPMGSYSQCEPISEERELDSSMDAQVDKGSFWDVPSEDLPIDLMKKSKDLLSRNLLRMFPLEERECPYCPDKFHTGIGLANHVRGHLKRVGISYNTRHFISAEEVTAIEKEFSLQKLKRKALKFRGGSVEKCNLCGASFDSRAGMSSHARAHLRELGVMTWSATSSPIDLLNELLQDLALPGLTEGKSLPDAAPKGPRGYGPGATAAGSEAPKPRPLAKLLAPANSHSAPLRNKVVIIDPDDDEVSTLELELPSGHSSGESELQEKNGLMGTIDANSQTTPVHPKQSFPKIAMVTQGEDSLQSNKLLNSCQLCGTCFETRKGLSSHARFHLRQFGVPDSESSGAPIGTLYELMKRKGIPSVLPSALASDKPQSYTPKDMTGLKPEALDKPLGEECQGETTHTAKSPKLGMNSPPKGQSQTGSSTLKKVHPILPKPMSSKSPEQGKTGRSLMNTPQTSGELLSKKLFWSPQDDNTPLNLTVNSEHISCRLCGACFETRKGLSSHSRAHLRHFGAVDVDSKGSPIEALNEFIKKKGIQSALASMLPVKKPHSYPKVSALKAERSNFKSELGTPVNKKTSLTSPSLSTQKKLKQVTMGVHMESGISEASGPNNGLTSETYWPTSPINLSIDSAPSKETRCEFCGDYFENRKGLSSHARSHLRQFGVTEWTVNGSPIDTLKELMKRKVHPLESPGSPGLKMTSKPAATSMKSPVQGLQSEPFSPTPGKSSKFSLTIPSVRQVPSGSLVPKKVQGQFLSPPPMKKMKTTPLKKVKQEDFKTEYNPGEPATSLKSAGYLPEQMWSPRGDTSPLSLIDQPSKDVRCEFCGEYFENRKGLSSHARSHLRQFGVTEWTVNGSPIDTLKELMKRKGKPEPLGHEPAQRELQREPENYVYEEKPIAKPFGQIVKSPVKEMHQKHLSPPARKVLTYTPNSQHPTGSPLGKKIPMGFVSTAPLKKPVLEERSLPPELKPSYTPESGLFKPKSTWSPQEKVTTAPVIAADTCCELCGHYFENRKALASHARAHLRQFGVTEWHINGSPIDTLREWIRQKPNISMGASLNCVQDRPLPKPIRNHIKSMVKELPGELCSLPGGKTVKLEPKTVEFGFPASPAQKNPETEKMPPTECYIPTDLSQGSTTECTPSSSMPSEDDEPHPKKKRKHPVKLGTCEYCGVTLTTGVGLSNHMRGHLKSGLKRKLPSLSQFEELHEKAEPTLTDTYYERKQQKPVVCTENLSPKREEGKVPKTFRPKSEESRPLRVRPVIFPVPKPEPLSLVKFIGNIYTLKCRFCDVEFHGPLSIQEEWVRHLQRHILDMNFPKAETAREEISVSAEPEK
ncbi:protein Wiz-like isoform X2 [Heptranchias perlo]|uniref:protein Wiz-like isoform X2 n=1 Tax=Heptranchias perlo TaxID=212740 RepID=UPI00355A1B13